MNKQEKLPRIWNTIFAGISLSCVILLLIFSIETYGEALRLNMTDSNKFDEAYFTLTSAHRIWNYISLMFSMIYLVFTMLYLIGPIILAVSLMDWLEKMYFCICRVISKITKREAKNDLSKMQ